MKVHSIHKVMLVTLFFCWFSTCLTTEAHNPNQNSKYLDAVREFADNVLKYGRDTYGPKHTPLFVDGLMIRDPNNPNYEKDGVFKPVEWIAPNGDRWILSNLASQQNLFRTLDGLSTITGDPKYKQAATDAIKYAFDNLRSPNGLLYWGVSAAYDAFDDEPCGLNQHILKAFYPYYELMWQVNPKATEEFIEAFWASHILDWSNLDMNRVGSLDKLSVTKGWEHEYKGGPVFLESDRGGSFLNTGTDLICSAAWLTKLSGEKEPLVWAKRLAKRYVDTRHPNTGISYLMYTKPSFVLRESYDDVLRRLVPGTKAFLPDIFMRFSNPIYLRCNIGYSMPTPGIYINSRAFFWQSLFLVGEMSYGEGNEFKQWALEELTAFGRAGYRKKDNVYVPILTDGTNLEGYVVKQDSPMLGPKGVTLEPLPAGPSDFWSYTMGYRITRDEFMWEMANSIARGNDFGDIGATPKNELQLNLDTSCSDPYAILGFLELYRGTGKNEFLEIAKKIGDNLLDKRFHKGFFVASSNHIYTKFDSIDSLVLLHLNSALMEKAYPLSEVWPGRSLFQTYYRKKYSVTDNQIIYTLTESTEPTMSLQEAASIGDTNLVGLIIEKGTEVDTREDASFRTALHRAATSGHKDVIELLLAKGAQIDAWNGFPGGTPLDYAAENGHKEIGELLIAHGADVNAKREGYPAGDTPLHSAVRARYKDVVDLLIAEGADVNAKNKDGQTPLDIALRGRRGRDIFELLVEKGADVTLHTAVLIGDLAKVKSLIEEKADINAKDASGNTPLYYAVQQRNKDIAELLIASGADVNAKDGRGDTYLHFIAKNPISGLGILLGGFSWESIVQSLLNNGADVNMRDSKGRTPLWWALERNNGTVIELLRKHGAKD